MQIFRERTQEHFSRGKIEQRPDTGQSEKLTETWGAQREAVESGCKGKLGAHGRPKP